MISAYANSARQPNFQSGPGSCCMGICDDDGGTVAEQQWTFVGQGQGSHHCVPQYVYAGEGAGAWEAQERHFVDPRAKDRVRRLQTVGVIGGCLVLLALSIASAVYLDNYGAPEPFERFAKHAHHHLSTAGQHIGGHLNTVGQHIGNAAKVVHGHVVHHGGNAWNAVQEHAPGVWEKVKHHTGNAVNAVKEHGPGVWEHVKNASVAVGSAAHGAITEHGPGVWDHVTNATQKTVATASAATANAQSALLAPTVPAQR